ncbi:hypothetical protein POK33_29310 [Burkholderia cenocepacia]|uniref:hypothetical protein n=1 Tax=Burkholderia cenocepacia TaxID=95486 RepID=UPI0023B964FC|nr:hypothetical protein [Burkholderia cenocepacia]MDF0504837.1 hypothetical protein [Burkholderia cenocepacia]
MSQASKDALNELHGLIATALTDAIKAYKGKTDPEELKGLAALANVAKSFLKDNGIEALPSANKPLQGLASVLPFPGHVGGEGEDDEYQQAESN